MSTTLESTLRIKNGSNDSKQIRLEGFVPAVIYGLNKESISVTISEKHMDKLLKNEFGENVIIDLSVQNDNETSSERVKTYNIQRNAISGRIESVDFIRVDDSNLVKSIVPLRIVGNCAALKMGGAMVRKIREVTISSLASVIPQAIDVDITDVKIGEFVRVKDIPASEDYTVLTSPMEPILKIAGSRNAATATEGTEEAA